MRLVAPGVVAVVLPYILVLARGGAEVHRILFTGALLVPFAQQGDGVLHDPPRSCAFEAQQPILVITLPLAAEFAKVFHRDRSTQYNQFAPSEAELSVTCGNSPLGLHRNA